MPAARKLTVHCLGCYHQAVKTFEELKLWNDMIFVDVPQERFNWPQERFN